MKSQPGRRDGILLDFVEIPYRRGENVPYKPAQVGQPGKV